MKNENESEEEREKRMRKEEKKGKGKLSGDSSTVPGDVREANKHTGLHCAIAIVFHQNT